MHLRTGVKISFYLLVIAITAAIGCIDYVTGADVYVTSLYFVPLAIAGWRLGRTGALLTAMMAVLVWFLAMYFTAPHYSLYVWLANILSQIIAFFTLALLVASLSESLERERNLSRTDYLTGLKNRRAFIEHASVALSICGRHGHPAALAYIDLNNFKQINDNLGHDQGDLILATFGRLIGACSRESDIAARLGGDEFAIFLPETNAENALALLERIRDAFAESDVGRNSGVTASMGLVIDQTARHALSDLLKYADQQMYEAKCGNTPPIATHMLDCKQAQLA